MRYVPASAMEKADEGKTRAHFHGNGVNTQRITPGPVGLAIAREMQDRVKPAESILPGSTVDSDHRPDSGSTSWTCASTRPPPMRRMGNSTSFSIEVRLTGRERGPHDCQGVLAHGATGSVPRRSSRPPRSNP